MMGDRLRFTVLGCGSSPGTPRITGDWGDCDPANPRNRRLRAAAMFERVSPSGGVTRVVVDTGPDFREQMLAAGVRRLDAVVYTHAHADHIHGIDDLRGYWQLQRRLIDVYADRETLDRLYSGFRYCFETPAGGNYPPTLRANLMVPPQPFTVTGEGGDLTFEPLAQIHGDSTSLALRVGPVAYCPDVNDFPPQTAARLEGLRLLVIDALQYRSHPSHFSLREALAWIERLRPEKAVLTHMHTPLDYDRVMEETPVNVVPAHDGLAFEFDLQET